MAVSALDREHARSNREQLIALVDDQSEPVRTAVAEALGLVGPSTLATLRDMEHDASETVREAVATAYGDIGDAAPLGWLIEAANNDDNRQVREAAVAALGSIGDPRAVGPLLDLIKSGPPQVRRRAIAAITVFDDPRIEPAIRAAALDRNPGVREAAEMVVGRQIVASEG
jgi:HEAT repeat protein